MNETQIRSIREAIEAPPQALEEPPRQRQIPRRAGTSPYPLSPGQRQIWFFRELAPEVPLYNDPLEAVRLLGELNVGAMQRALDAVVARHEVLRTTFQSTEQGVVAGIHENWPLAIKQIDLSDLVAEQRETEVERLLIDEPRRLYNLESEPGIRATLLRLSAREHVLILMMHHIISDRWSMGVVWRELAALYQAFVCGETPELSPLSIQNGDYVVWQLQRAEADFAADLAYWEDNLRGAPDLLQLPTDRPRPRIQSYRGRKQRFRLNAALAEGLRDRSRREKTTLFDILTAALNALLYRYTGSDDLVLGIAVADRRRPEVQSLIGFLVDTHALRTRLYGDMTFRELLGRVKPGLRALYTHKEISFDRVVSRVRPDRSLSHSPLFQVMITWRDRIHLLPFIGLHGLAVEPVLAQNKASKFDLSLFLTDSGDDIWLEAEYSTDLFDEDRIARIFGHYQTVLEAVVADADQCLAKLPLLTEAERGQLLVEWNATEAEYPKERCLHQLFEQRVERDPDAIAVLYEDRLLSYGELNARSNRLAHHLRALGVGPDALVAICVERSLEMVESLLAVLKAGGAYVPLDPTYPADRLAFMIRDSAPAMVLSHGLGRAALEAAMAGLAQPPPILDLEVDAPQWAGQPITNPDPAAVGLTPSHLAYVIYTSGSAGTPKGVQVPHRALVNCLTSISREPGIAPSDRLLAVTTLSFDIAALELFLPLVSGARVVIAPSEAAVDGKRLLALMEDAGVTVMQATPATWRLLLDSEWRGRKGLKVLCGGEAWPAELADALLPRCASLWNMYGPTETTIWSSAASVEKGKPVLIGPPIANTTFYILDTLDQPVPVGVAGEIHIGGTGVARGYLNRPEQTAERFIASPFVAGDRLYKTGDLGRYLADGKIEFLGRNDFQVKIRGHRIELVEIEARLSSYPGVRETAVLAREDATGDKRLVAYYAVAGGEEPGAVALRVHLAGSLPEYMVPAAFVMLDKLPLTPNGKLDRKALPAPDGTVYATQAYQGPIGPLETAIAEIWAKILDLEQVGRHDNFFDLGGDSLRAVRLLVAVNRSFGRQLPLRTIYDSPTVAGLASLLDSKTVTQLSSIVSLKSGKIFPPLFIVCGAAGNFTQVATLAEYISDDRDIYALESIGLDGMTKPHQRVETMAEYYLDHIRKLQPNGPYLLAGFSFGGYVALEIAQRSLRNGEDIALLALLDTAPHSRLVPLSSFLVYWKRRIYVHAAVIARLPLLKVVPYGFRRLISVKEHIRTRYFGWSYCWQPRLDTTAPDVVKTVLDSAGLAWRLYHPQYYPGTITLLKAERTGDGFWRSYEQFWGKRAAKLEICNVPGAHLEIVKTHADALGAQLSLCIEKGLDSVHYGRSATGTAARASSREPA